MNVPALRYAAPLLGVVRQGIALDDGHSRVEVGEHPGCLQAGHARPEHNRSLTDVCHADLR
jgi:hypothetical protein